MRADNPANFARIEFLQDECQAIKELRHFIEALAFDARLGDATQLNRLKVSLKRGCEGMGMVRSHTFTEVDLTLDECQAVCECGEFFERVAHTESMRFARNRTLEQLRLALRRARMKCSVACEIIKPNLITDPRLN